MKDTYNVRICFEKAPKYIPTCGGHTQQIKEAGGCPDQNPCICYVWFKGITSVPLTPFNIAYAQMCGDCLIKALNCEEYTVEQVTFHVSEPREDVEGDIIVSGAFPSTEELKTIYRH